MQLSAGFTRAELCERNGHRIYVVFRKPQTLATARNVAAAIGGKLACGDGEDEQPQQTATAESSGAGDGGEQPKKMCYFVTLPPDMCCGDAIGYFRSLESPPAVSDIARPSTPCSCDTYWSPLDSDELKK